MSVGITATSPTFGTNLNNWVQTVFGASSIEPMDLLPGQAIQGVWRPCLFFETQLHQALGTDEYMRRNAEQSLRVLIEKLDEILLYIEPTQTGLLSYGHKTRELLILACTEVENLWTQFMRLASAAPARRSFTTSDYVRLQNPLHLAEYEIGFRLIRNGYSIAPFAQWNSQHPTQSIPWYDAYNKTKHDRETHFELATLDNCLQALAAVIVLFCVKYGPYTLVEGASTLTGLFTQHFDISLANPDPKTFYIPTFNLPAGMRNELLVADMTKFMEPWQSIPLVI